MEKYSVYGNLVAESGKGEELLGYLLEAAREMEQVDGCYCYIVGTNEEESDTIYVFEVWEDEDAHKQSLQMGMFRELILKAKPIIEDMNSFKSLTIHGGKAKF